MTGIPSPVKGSRIPAALQNVFLQSQAGEDVEKIAAPSHVGFRVFQRMDKRNKNKKTLKAPDVNSLYAERNGTKDSAATASRKAMKDRGDDGSVMVRVCLYLVFCGCVVWEVIWRWLVFDGTFPSHHTFLCCLWHFIEDDGQRISSGIPH
jgi:hypothetical protein